MLKLQKKTRAHHAAPVGAAWNGRMEVGAGR